ncbi:von Willebrand factor type A domain-containing protein [Goodfellowiella coeruleoviolacea]|uniref:von Willebrand factor type A domain-containing protein n=1 Tax=Goodfellowiella coeruleoviolacea TaxID=334858 RepID=A0AAE3KI67_9PSEU|nr:von Willebrand factor type A domain-containing protein [Goodfellowiella coeruleoviolacea]
MPYGISRYSRIAALFLATLITATPEAVALAEPNPPWPGHCPLRITLVIDQSDSMNVRFPQVREATKNVVDALRDKSSTVTVVGFGTAAATIRSSVDVSDEDSRHRLKDDIDGLGTASGATNWDAALATAEGRHQDVVVLVTDGMPTVYGDPARDGPDDPVVVAAATADRLKRAGTRVAAVGIELAPDAEANLRAITGPEPDQDYFVGEQSSLLRTLYEVVASACGVPFEALPKPEPSVFPWSAALTGTAAVAALVTMIAWVLHRRRRPPAAVASEPVRRGNTPTAIDHQDLTRKLRDENAAAPRRSMSLDFLDRQPPNTKDNP